MVDCSLVGKAPTEHLKMMRLLFLCLLLLLPAAADVADLVEGSADDDADDEDYTSDLNSVPVPDKTKGKEEEGQMTLIIIIVAAVVLSLTVATVVTILLVRRHVHNRQQGIYSVPIEQDQKGAI
ncbi:uncharacterized protein si:dkey-262k9.2 isoform X2 [Mugil cephalus]|uniref:uncharacterized protein si:dkey-262k9.2 isoform X2 n=2 Tax=Mugil cephalus TaxID=48193 RepID=UPI001FB744B2|nr:uncharacterized protein si:dkey-262k9.2 isoform X2 [Mugil cephalus]